MKVRIVADLLSPVAPPAEFVWLRSSVVHLEAARRLWEHGEISQDLLTLFEVSQDASPEQACLQILDEVCIHHPDWTDLEISGATLTPELRQELTEIGVHAFMTTADGFVARRDPPID